MNQEAPPRQGSVIYKTTFSSQAKDVRRALTPTLRPTVDKENVNRSFDSNSNKENMASPVCFQMHRTRPRARSNLCGVKCTLVCVVTTCCYHTEVESVYFFYFLRLAASSQSQRSHVFQVPLRGLWRCFLEGMNSIISVRVRNAPNVYVFVQVFRSCVHTQLIGTLLPSTFLYIGG